MNYHRLPSPQPSLLQRAIAAVVGAVVLAGLFIVGVFASVVLAGAALVGGIALSIWVWRQRRQFERFRAAHEEKLRQAMGEAGDSDAIEGEFVVRERRKH
ncbi:MAG: hypothetical protein HKN49_02860 [Gammaproteobacteria bacterium]|nr:hypothetical protein [Gammaproteobacteria bacterium]